MRTIFRLYILMMLVCFFAAFSNEALGQSEGELLDKVKVTTNDSLKADLYKQLYILVFKADKVKAIEYGKQIIKYGELAGNPSQQILGKRAVAGTYSAIRNYSKAFEYDEEALVLAKKMNTPKILFRAHLDYATHYIDAEMASKALQHLQDAKMIAEKENFPNANEARATVYNRLGWYYKSIANDKESIDYFEKALAYCDTMGMAETCANTKKDLAMALFDFGKFERIPPLLDSAIQYFRLVKFQSSLATCLAYLGKCYFQIGNFSKGLSNYKEAKDLYKGMDNKPSAGMALVDIAGAYLAENDLKNALANLKEATQVLDNTPFDYALVDLYKQWGVYNIAIKNTKIAKTYFAKADSIAKNKGYTNLLLDNLKYKVLLNDKQPAVKSLQAITPFKKDTSGTKTFNQELLEVEAAYRVKQQRDSLTLQHQQIKIQADSLKLKDLEKLLVEKELKEQADSLAQQAKQKIIDDNTIKQKADSITIANKQLALSRKSDELKTYSLIFSGLVVTILVALWFLQRKYRKKAEADKLRIAYLHRERSHDIVNSITIVETFIVDAAEKSKEAYLFKKIQNQIVGIKQIHELIYQNNTVYLDAFVNDIVNKEIAIFAPANVNFKVDVLQEQLKYKKIECLGIIIKELITNSLKHAFPAASSGTISITLQKKGEALHLHYYDTGIGIPASVISDSECLSFIKGNANELGEKFEFYNNNGMHFEMHFSNNEK